MNAEELKSKCIEDLRAEYKKAIEERDTANQGVAAAIELLDGTQQARNKYRKERDEIKARYNHLSEQCAKAIKDLKEMQDDRNHRWSQRNRLLDAAKDAVALRSYTAAIKVLWPAWDELEGAIANCEKEKE